MRVFEFYFNPKVKEDLIFNTFCYSPENNSEKRLGNLYMAGTLRNSLPQNRKLLEKISRTIKENYYKPSNSSPEKSLKEGLKEVNKFLEEIVKKGDVSWLGNLSFAVLSLFSQQKTWRHIKLNFTKVGEIKIFLLRSGKIIDIDKNIKIKLQGIEPYPLKIFGNIVSSRLTEDDLILVLTKELSEFFQEENLLEKIAKLARFSEKGFRDIFNEKKDDLTKISGIFLAIGLGKEEVSAKKATILPEITPKDFSLKEVFSPFFQFFKFPQIEIPKSPTKFLKTKIQSFVLNKKVISIISLTLILLFGFIFSQIEKEQKIKLYQNNLKDVQKNLNLANSYLILENPQAKEKANSLLKKSWEGLSPILKDVQNLPKYFSSQVLPLENEILAKLYSLNKLEKVETPELFFEFKAREFIPQKIIVNNDNLYLFSSYAKNIIKIDKEKKLEIISIDRKFNSASLFDNSILFFSKPNQLTILNGQEQLSANLKEPYPDFNFDDFSVYKGNLYFFDKKAGQIIKYGYLKNFEWGNPEFWLKRAINGESMAVGSSIWVLEKDNLIGRYYMGNLQEKIEPNIFPMPKDFSQIFSSPFLSYLYLLEPVQKRIIILTKEGRIIKQFQSEKFDNLLDFSVSEDGKTIWLLNGLKIYKINP